MSSVYNFTSVERQDLTIFQQAGDWVKNNPTTIKAMASAGVVFGGILFILATSPVLGGAATVSLLFCGAVISLVSAVIEVYADHRFQRLCQEEKSFLKNQHYYPWNGRRIYA